jgi:ferritin-like metal-binding protein YciE
MSGASERLREVYVTGLRNAHAVENQAVELLERQVGRLENYPEMSARMRQHIEESKEQARRIEELLSGLGTSHSSFKDMVTSFMGNIAAMGHATASDEVLKNTLANYAFEHYEIATYRALLTMADACGHRQAETALRQSLKEEEEMAQWIGDHLAPTVQRYLQRYQAGEKAGV